jgi:hypothetical protein
MDELKAESRALVVLFDSCVGLTVASIARNGD